MVSYIPLSISCDLLSFIYITHALSRLICVTYLFSFNSYVIVTTFLCIIEFFLFFLMIRRPPRSTRTDTLFPYPTLVRSFPQNLVLAALGNSASTPDKGIEGEVAYFPTLADLEAAPEGSLKGRIVFVSHAMHATQDGSSYGYFGATRRQGPSIASKKGAIAILIRSIGTDNHRQPHTGVQMWADGVKPIPAAALSVPDAEQLARMVSRGQPVRLHLTLTSKMLKDQPSGNVIAEIPGSDPKAGVVVAACHLDSWDQGTGAIDDGAGCGLVAAAALQAAQAGPP